MNIKNYKIISEVRKTMSVFVYPNKDVLIKVPLNANQEKIDDFIKRKSDWIQKQLDFFSRPKVVAVDSLSNGSELFLLGKQYQLIIVNMYNNRCNMRKIILCKVMLQWYRLEKPQMQF